MKNGRIFRYLKKLKYLEYYTNKPDVLGHLYSIYLIWYCINLKCQFYILPNCVGPELQIIHHCYKRVDLKKKYR